MVSQREFGAFGGVFVPAFLSAISVIFFLRLGYVTGSAGILGASLIIILAISVTLATGLSLSSVTTNIRIGGGGAYSIIRKTLGLEIGGSVGIPLYLAYVFNIALYLFGFMEAWQFVFPQHPQLLILIGALISLIVLAGITTEIAVKTQQAVFWLVLAALASVFLGANFTALQAPVSINLDSTTFWTLFALFFPATTSLMAGIGLSGRLTDPKKQIPRGVLGALATTTIIYLAATLWFGSVADAQQLITNNDIVVTQAAIPAVVLLGILAATFSSALANFSAAPELLAAMANNRVVPYSKQLAKRRDHEPTNAVLLTTLIVAGILSLGSLNAVAPILTMFFLLAYAIINFSVYLEKNLGNVSFRPTLKIPGWVSLYGATAGVVIMFMISPVAALAALTFMILTYLALVHKQLHPDEGDARSGLFREIARWAAEKVNNLPEGNKHNWKPSILLPVVTTRTLLGNFPVIKSIATPNGTMTVLGLRLTGRTATPEKQEVSKKSNKQELEELPRLIKKFGEEHLFINHSVVEVKNYTDGICVALESIKSQVFHPNLLYLSFTPKELPKNDLARIFKTAHRAGVGVIMLDRDEELGLGSEQDLHIWIPESAMKKDLYKEHSFDLAMILAYRLYANWDGTLTLHLATSKRNRKKARRYLEKLLYEARFPQNTQVSIHATKDLHEAIREAPNADIHLMPVSTKDVDKLTQFSAHKGKTWLYCADSDDEDILA